MSNFPPAKFDVVAEERQSRYGLNTQILATAITCFVFFVALLVFLHLYARYFPCRHRAAIVRLFLLRPATVPRDEAPRPGLDPVAIAALPTYPYRRTISISNGKSDGNDAECTICLNVIEEGERVRLLPSCRHVFHVGCIDTWLSSSSTCPVCRAAVEAAPVTVVVEMGESSASQPGVFELSGAGGGAGNTS
ncbi:RING-H2 finger protein ATL40 [Cocos nucifera]|uniref:RING-type E3 ubiquitin transferase n=1 Tax=Cocos nucifera TaxID=13894 RepID=A0A8K0NCT0_COCNU|nr:RING-H2 finger protein ATL40 [Cocos nucifera]